MIWVFFIAVAVLVVVGIAALMTGRLSVDPVPPPVSTVPDTGLAEGFGAQEIQDLRFDTALRGYRMDQVDDALDVLHARIRELEGADRASRPADPTEPVAPAEPVETADPADPARPTGSTVS